MSDLLRTIIKWVLVIVLTILVILLVIKIAKRNSNKATQKEPIRSIEKIKLDDEDDEDEDTKKAGSDNKESTLVVNLGDTASTRGITVWIGVIVLGTTTYYIYKSRQVNE